MTTIIGIIGIIIALVFVRGVFNLLLWAKLKAWHLLTILICVIGFFTPPPIGEEIAKILIFLGIIIHIICRFILIVRAFKISFVWVLVCLFVPFGTPAFVISHWEVAKEPFLKSFIIIPFAIVSLFFDIDNAEELATIPSILLISEFLE